MELAHLKIHPQMTGQSFAISWQDTKKRMYPDIAFSSIDQQFLAVWQCEYNPGDMDVARNGATAMALLPFLGAGQTHFDVFIHG